MSPAKRKRKEAAFVGLALLKGVALASEGCAPLNGVTNCAVYVAELVVVCISRMLHQLLTPEQNQRNLNQTKKSQEWTGFGRHVELSMAILVDALQNPGCSADCLRESLDNLKEDLYWIRNEIVKLQDEKLIRRVISWLRDPEKINSFRRAFDDSVKRFQLQTSIRIANKLQDAVTEPAFKRWVGNIVDAVTNEIVNVIEEQAAHTVESIKLHTALEFLRYTGGASYKFMSGCMEGTRSELLLRIQTWIDSAKESSSKSEIYWLRAVAGAGKSAVAHSVARTADENGLLASSFFLQCGTEGRDSPRALLSTMIRDLASKNQQFGDAVGAAIDADRALAASDVQRQFDRLLLPYSQFLPKDLPIVFVIDALDEVSNEIELRQLLDILRRRIPELPGSIRIFVTSGRLEGIDRALAPSLAHLHIETIDTRSTSNQADINIFVNASLHDVAEEQFLRDWPKPGTVGLLVAKAEGLFIWVAVIINLLRFKTMSPARVLNDILDNSNSGLSPKSKMDEMYARTLEVCGKWDDRYFCQGYQAVMGTIIAAQSPISFASIQSFYRQEVELPETFPDILQCISPLLVGFDNDHNDKSINVIHLSFREFVTGDSHSKLLRDEFRVSLFHQHEQLALRCLQILNDELNESTPGVGLLDLEQEGIPSFDFSRVSEDLFYASQYWKSHLKEITRVFPDQVCQTLVNFTTGRRLRDWIEFGTCSRSYQKVTDLTGVIKDHVHDADGILESLGSAELAESLPTLQDCLKYMNRLEEALSAAEDAVKIYRSLANTQPDTFNPYLAGSLLNFSLCLSVLGRREDALKAIQESVDIHRSLPAARPEAFNPDLADSLNNFSINLSDLGRREDALKAIQEAVDIRRSLAAAWPEAFNLDLADSLNNYSSHLSDLGRHEDALKFIQESVDMYRLLAAARPEAFNPDLAKSLNNLSIGSGNLHKWREASTASKEAVEIYRPLSVTYLAVYRKDLGDALVQYSDCLRNAGNQDEADVVFHEYEGIKSDL